MQEVGREEGVNLEKWNGDQIESMSLYLGTPYENQIEKGRPRRKRAEGEMTSRIRFAPRRRRIRPTAFSHPTKNMTVMVGR